MSEIHIEPMPFLDTKSEVLGIFPDWNQVTIYIKLPQNK